MGMSKKSFSSWIDFDMIMLCCQIFMMFSYLCFISYRNSFNHNHEISGERGFILCFTNSPPSTIFTCSKMEAKDGNPIRIKLLDANTNTLVTFGPLSSMKIEVVVLDGDFRFG